MKKSVVLASIVLSVCISFANIASAGQYVLHLQTDQAVYQLGGVVTIFGDMIYNGTQVNGLVAIQADRNGTPVLFRTVYTGAASAPPLGDINGDGVVDILDVVIVASAYGTVPTDPNWNSIADLNGDGSVDILDIVTVSGHYGENGWGTHFLLQLLSVYITDLSNNVVSEVDNGSSYLVYSVFRNSGFFSVHVQAAFTIYDTNNVPIYALSAAAVDAQPGQVCTIVGQWDVPAEVTAGPAMVYMSIFSDEPSLGGFPYSPEKSKAFTIASSGGTMSTGLLDQKTQTAGTFETAFKIPNDALWAGTYAIFGASIYESGANTFFYFNSTSIQVNP